MLHHKQKEAIEREDWDAALKIEQLIQAQIDREIKLSQLAKNEIDVKVADSQIVKNIAEAQKAKREKQFSIGGLFGTLIAAFIALYSAIIKGIFK